MASQESLPSYKSDAMEEEDMTSSQLAREADALIASCPGNDRLEDGLATQPATIQPATIQPAGQAGDDVTGKCASSNGESTGDEDDDEEDGEEEADESQAIDGLLRAGGQLMSRFASQSQATDDGDDYEEERDEQIRAEYWKLKGSAWMQKRLTQKEVEVGKLMKKHEESKRNLVKPVNDLMKLYPEKKKALTLMSGLLSDACTDGDLRDAIIDSANVLKSHLKMVEDLGDLCKYVRIGTICVEEKKAEEAAKHSASSSTMSAAAALIASSSSKKRKK